MTDYISGINKTGFILENNINQELRKSGWNIINNKFYEDDLVDTVREMDILAYKVSTIDDINIYTTLLISCKKNEENAWALVSRDIKLDDPNSNWWPTHIWTNDIAMKQQLKAENSNKEYYRFLCDKKHVAVMQPPEVDVFAYQELNKLNGRPQNDKNIFSSLTTLMKAQSYEIGALDNRINNKSIYQFNLISVIESDLIRIHIMDNELSQKDIETEQLVARYIIRKKEQFFRIRFLKAAVFSDYLKSYNLLHDSNIEFFKYKRDNFYHNLIKDYNKVKMLSSEFSNEIIKHIRIASGYNLSTTEIEENLFIYWEDNRKYLRIYVTENEEICNRLKLNKELLLETKKQLLKILRFDGVFEYSTDGLPF